MKMQMMKWYEYPLVMWGKYFYTTDAEGFEFNNTIYLIRLD